MRLANNSVCHWISKTSRWRSSHHTLFKCCLKRFTSRQYLSSNSHHDIHSSIHSYSHQKPVSQTRRACDVLKQYILLCPDQLLLLNRILCLIPHPLLRSPLRSTATPPLQFRNQAATVLTVTPAAEIKLQVSSFPLQSLSWICMSEKALKPPRCVWKDAMKMSRNDLRRLLL